MKNASENADYDAAKERQGFIEGRINEIERKLAGAQVIDPAAIGMRAMRGLTPYAIQSLHERLH